VTINDADLPAALRPIPLDDPRTTLTARNLRLLEAASHNAALIASDDPSRPSTDEDCTLRSIARYVGHLTASARSPSR
jgi:hypothetical protein